MGVKQVQGDILNPVIVKKMPSKVWMPCHVVAKTGVWGDYKDYCQITISNEPATSSLLVNPAGVSLSVYTSLSSGVFHGGDMEGVDKP